MQARRLLHSTSSAASNAVSSQRIAKMINPLRNKELQEYQEQIKKVRQELTKNRSGALTKDEAAKVQQAEKRSQADGLWRKYLAEVKGNLDASVMETNEHHATQKHHPCRPTIDHCKTEEQRAAGAQNLAKALRPALVMRRKYVKTIWDLQADFVNRDNLDSKIEYAISHPTSYNISPERTVIEEKHLESKLREIKVPSDLEEDHLEISEASETNSAAEDIQMSSV